jgi:hypothetical protein
LSKKVGYLESKKARRRVEMLDAVSSGFHPAAVAKNLEEACKLVEIGSNTSATWITLRSSESENKR